MKFYLIFLLLLPLFSCGVLKTRNEYISIDSKPRGLIVYRQEEGKELINKIGTTPMFLQVPKGSKDIFMLKDPTSDKRSVNTTPENICRYLREGEQFFPKKGQKEDGSKLVVKFVESWTPQNLLKGSSFECVTIVQAKLKTSKTFNKKNTCNTYLIMPPRSSYLKVSRDLAKEWVERVFNKQKKPCDKVITPAVSEQHMLFLGISELTGPQDITEMGYQKFIDLAAKFQATDLVFLPYKKEDKTFIVSPKIYDIHTGKKTAKALTKKYQTTLNISGGYKFSNFFLSLFRFIPNGVAAQGKFRNRLHGEGVDEEKFSKNYENFIPSISINNIEYPQYKWKGQTRIVPHIVWEYWGDELRMDLYGLMLDLKWFWHLPPGGVIVARGGFGGTYIFSKFDDVGYSEKTGSWIGNIGAEYYFFPWKRIYILGGYRRYFIPKKISGPTFAVTGESRFFLNIGYFWPELRTAVRRWLKF